ncbi:MAG: orotate phosphoribosyltransferase, partial [Candidatus Eisenbacteria bacterium]|nr:orotate phosphoribosyltransferase [Candidatus Latescibacterota bacterium]MBD3301213.1 orotate phosphoribosyltransferase [Candidatus Eisenbacteria bacterium]
MKPDRPATEEELRARLIQVILRRSFRRGRFQLSSGAWSDYYLDLRRTTLDPDGLAAAVALLAPLVAECDADAVGGPTIG